ncbi:MAG: glycosyltransferase family 4 protein [Nitrospirae bacterium]|nr:glycosyltransferase family 4 protein [Nitrospirota bacterium]
MKIAVSTAYFSEWMGGINYITNLYKSVMTYDPSVKFYNYGKVDAEYKDRIQFAGDFASDSSYLFSIRWYTNEVLLKKMHLSVRIKPAYIKKLKGIDVCYQIGDPLMARYIPSIEWIPDFQHIHYPDYFSAEEIKIRDNEFQKIAQHATIVIVSSNNARKDFISLFPEHESKVRVLQFVCDISAEMIEKKDLTVFKRYDIPEKYFYLPNQFWKHKNHKVVFDAVKILLNNNFRVNVVMTGDTNDYRNPGYFKELLKYCDELDVTQDLYFLGQVPFTDVMNLMKCSQAVINPSLFEGWSTTVEETKSMGHPVILSDIDVHKEQSPGSGFYFRKNDPEHLAEIMKAIWLNPVTKIANPAELLADNRKRQEKFGKEFLQCCKDAIKVHQ